MAEGWSFPSEIVGRYLFFERGGGRKNRGIKFGALFFFPGNGRDKKTGGGAWPRAGERVNGARR